MRLPRQGRIPPSCAVRARSSVLFLEGHWGSIVHRQTDRRWPVRRRRAPATSQAPWRAPKRATGSDFWSSDTARCISAGRWRSRCADRLFWYQGRVRECGRQKFSCCLAQPWGQARFGSLRRRTRRQWRAGRNSRLCRIHRSQCVQQIMMTSRWVTWRAKLLVTPRLGPCAEVEGGRSSKDWPLLLAG